MAYQQKQPFIASRAGTKPYWCLQNVRLGYGLGPHYQFALQDWQNNHRQHADRNFPAGVAVPVYFNWWGSVDGEYRNWGHIAVRLPDGRVWTDGRYYNNVDDLSRYYLSGSSYLGWGESVENVRVVQDVIVNNNGGTTMITRKGLEFVFSSLLGRNPDAGAYAHYVGNYSFDFVIDDVGKSAERRAVIAANQAAENARNQQIKDLQTALANEKNKPPKEVIKEVEKIVEKPVEVEKIVEKVVEPSWLVKVREFIKDFLAGNLK